jgi:hypothetical protein
MASLISPGVSVTITDQSFYIPATAPTVPLIFIATADQKTQPDGVSPAAGTYENNVIRTVTSLLQSTQLYGVPNFLVDSNGNPQHGDARNEYGVYALNQYLGVGNLAYVVRANVNLNDNYAAIAAMWNTAMQQASYVLQNSANAYIQEYNQSNGYVSTNPNYKTTLIESEFLSLATSATANVWALFSFSQLQNDFINDQSASPFAVYANGYNNASTGTFIGLTGMANAWVANGSGSVVATGWTAAEAANMLVQAANSFVYTSDFLNKTSLGANDASRRVAITTALAAVINSNTDIRSENYEYNIIVCPGFPEVATELENLCLDINQEAFVIGETPFTSTPDTVVSWAGTTARVSTSDIAYYYPHGLGTNIDGATIFVAASGIALRTIAYSDSIGNVWDAPAGVFHGIVTGINAVGYVSGTLGQATTFVPVNLNEGQRNNLYKDFTNINPIAFFPGNGILLFGQKTSLGADTAQNRINVERLLKMIKRQLRKSSFAFLFQPNTQVTRNSLKSAADSFLGTLLQDSALYDFATVCDSTNNTASVIDNNEMILDIALKPTKTAEFIYVNIRVVATGASLTA